MTTPRLLPPLDDLSLEQKIGQMLCLGWGGPSSCLSVNEQARRCMTDLHAGGMIVMGRNVSPPGMKPLPSIDAAGVRRMLDDLQDLASIPLLIPTDQEGGRVARFGGEPFTRMPSARDFGRHNDPDATGRASAVACLELLSVGVNWNFAPVADVNSNPDNPVIGDRSFGDTPEQVIPHLEKWIAGAESVGLLACAKHFPGHGDTALDSHFALPTLPFSKQQMLRRELLPFQAAIAARVPTIMTAHILFPALDPDLPATLSRAILTGLLREEMGFDGLIVTDCLEMKAVADGWGTAQAALRAAQAGADMLLICHTYERQRETFDLLLSAARTGELPLARIDEAARRVLAAKQWLADHHAGRGEDTAAELARIGTPEARTLRDRIATPTQIQATTLGAEAPA